MNRTRVKICGITRPQDAQDAIAAGADAIGLVFWEPSSRFITIEQAKQICANIPAFVSIVALTVNAEPALLEQIIDQLPITVLQFHGDESPAHCESFKRPFIKALRVQQNMDLTAEIEKYPCAQGILLDAYTKGLPGGTGQCFDWSLIPEKHKNQIVLAGGLNVTNIQQAVIDIQPYAVDVSGGVELSAGIKDCKKMNEFIANVNTADNVNKVN